MRCFVLLVFLVFLALPSAAIADSATAKSASIASATAARCDGDAGEALKQARGMIAEESAGSERATLVCLIQATTALNEQLSARLSALENRFPAPHQAISITTDHLDNSVSAAPSPFHDHGKP